MNEIKLSLALIGIMLSLILLYLADPFDNFQKRLDKYDNAVTLCLDTERYTEDICRELARVEVWGR